MSKISSIYNSVYQRREIYSDSLDDDKIKDRVKDIYSKKSITIKQGIARQQHIEDNKTKYGKYNEYAHTKVTFGKHKGKWLSEVPIDYIKWGVMNLDPYTATIFSVELQRRDPKFRK